VNTVTEGSQYEASVAALDGGGFVVSWQTWADGQSDIFAQIYDASGAPVGGEFMAHAAPGGEEALPQATALTGGGFVLSWYDFDASSGASAQAFDASGAPLGGRLQLGVNAPTVLPLDDGGFLLFADGPGAHSGERFIVG